MLIVKHQIDSENVVLYQATHVAWVGSEGRTSEQMQGVHVYNGQSCVETIPWNGTVYVMNDQGKTIETYPLPPQPMDGSGAVASLS